MSSSPVEEGSVLFLCASLERRFKKGKERKEGEKLTAQRRHNLVHLTVVSRSLKRRGRY